MITLLKQYLSLVLAIAALVCGVVPSQANNLHQAVLTNNVARLSKLIDSLPHAINDLDAGHMTPLNIAARLGNTEAVRLLIDAGADMTRGDAEGSTPLHLAAAGGHIEAMLVMLDKGASLDIQDDNGTTALIHALAGRQYAVAQWLIEHGADVTIADGAGNSPLHWAVARRDANTVHRLIEAGADLDLLTSEGRSPLSYAALVIDTAIARILIANGAELESKDNWGRTPLSLTARETGNVGMAALLLDAGAQVNTKDESEDTPLMLAAWRGFKTLVATLLDHNASLPSDTHQQRELIGYATDHGIDRLFEALMRSGADIDFKAATGGTLLHNAAAGTSEEIVARLIRHGMDVNGKDLYGRTPLHYAAEEGRTDNVRTLLSNGAEIDARSKSGSSPLDLAREYARDSVAIILTQGGAASTPSSFAELTGSFLGQEKPGSTPRLFAPDIVSTHNFEHGCITFSPDGREAFWTTSLRLSDSGYFDCFIATSHVENERWTKPRMADFSSLESGDDVPFFSPDGDRLYFLSRRGPNGVWYIQRDGESWSEPQHIEGGPSENGPYWQISVAADGSIYTGAEGDVWVSEPADDGYTAPATLGSPIATEQGEGHPCIAPDGSFLIYQIQNEDDVHASCLYIAFRKTDDTWTSPIRLEPGGVPLKGMCPVLSPDGRFLFFNAWRQTTNDIYWVEIGSFIDSVRKEVVSR